MKNIKEIDIRDITGFRLGSAEYEEGGTGLTVIVADPAVLCSSDVRGGGPASREAALIDPLASNVPVNAVILSGGSAFGLNSAEGAVRYFEERNIGYKTAAGLVPIIPASCIYDLGVVSAKIRPDGALAYQACVNAETNSFKEGSYGAGCGATIGKPFGESCWMKSGQATYALQIGELKVGAIVVVNAMGDVHNYHDGSKIAGMRDPATGEFIDAEEALCNNLSGMPNYRENTTIGAILTNARLTKAGLKKVASMAHNGYGRTIYPVHTMFDGDTIYALTSAETDADINVVGTLACIAMAEAIMKAARPKGNSFGIPVAE